MPDDRLERTRAAYRETTNDAQTHVDRALYDALKAQSHARSEPLDIQLAEKRTDPIYEAIRDIDLWLRDKIATLHHRAKRGA